MTTKIILSAVYGNTQLTTNENDIMCGRGKAYSKNPGNIHFLTLIKATLQHYMDAPTPIDRGNIVAALLSNLTNDVGARFIKKDPHTKEWYIMSQEMAHDKIGHSIRDAIARQQRTKKDRDMMSKESTATTTDIAATKNEQHHHQQQQQQQSKKDSSFVTTSTSTSKVCCLEPICHRSDTFLNHDIKRAFSMKSTNLLASVLELQHLVKSVDNNNKDDDDHDGVNNNNKEKNNNDNNNNNTTKTTTAFFNNNHRSSSRRDSSSRMSLTKSFHDIGDDIVIDDLTTEEIIGHNFIH